MNSLTDNALMLAVKDGRVEKLGLLYERYKKWVYNFFVQINGDASVSEDLVQNVFMRILKYKHTYTRESTFVTWMFQIARNVSNDHFRKNKKNESQVQYDRASYLIGESDDIEAKIDTQERHQLLHRAIRQLPVEKREVIILSKLRELKYRQIGDILGCSEEAARTKAHRALKELRSIYLAQEI